MSADRKKESHQPDGEAKGTEIPPVSPVEDFDLGKIDTSRRIFGNGDTDRTSGKKS